MYHRPDYNHANPLNGRFLIYRLCWDENSLRQTTIDGGLEYDLFTEPFTINAESDEFRSPFYLIANLAVGNAAIDLRVLSYEFVILEEQGLGCEFAFDDIYCSGGLISGTDQPEYRPVGAKVLTNVPNPFNAGTDLRFDLPMMGPHGIEVFDIGGRRVTGFHGIGQVGVNAVRRDGCDDQGRHASAGVCHHRLLGAGSTASGKPVLVR